MCCGRSGGGSAAEPVVSVDSNMKVQKHDGASVYSFASEVCRMSLTQQQAMMSDE